MAKILIIDDSNLSRRLLRKILEDSNHTVLEAADGLSAIEIFMMERPDITFLDLTMPDLNGMDVLKQILEINKDAKVIIATADIQKLTKEKAEEIGAAAVINKPFIAELVNEAIQKVSSEAL